MRLCYTKVILSLLIFLTFISISLGNDELIISAHPDYPPIMWSHDKHLDGVAIKLAQTVFTELKIPFKIKYMGPWNRVQALARKGKIDFIVALYFNKQRETYLDFSAPFYEDPNAIWVKKGKPFNYKTWDDLIGKRGVTVFGDSFGEKLDKYIKAKLDIDRVYNMETGFKRLIAGKADYILWGYFPCLKNLQKSNNTSNIVLLSKDVAFVNLHMAFSKKSKYKYLLPQINKIITRLKKEGKIDEWITHYLDHYLSSSENHKN